LDQRLFDVTPNAICEFLGFLDQGVVCQGAECVWAVFVNLIGPSQLSQFVDDAGSTKVAKKLANMERQQCQLTHLYAFLSYLEAVQSDQCSS
jgi:hypothetical protein